MTSTALPRPSAGPADTPARPAEGETARTRAAQFDVAGLLCAVNESNEEVEDQCLRARQASDTADRSAQEADEALAAARAARIAHQSVQAEHPRRRAPLPRQWLIALITVALDGLACYFAAQALDGSQDATLVWAALFLAALAGGEFALDFYRDRSVPGWRVLASVLGSFIAVLGLLRFSYLATVGTGGLIPALAGAVLFTAATAGFLFLGYRALRAAEAPAAWRARRRAAAAGRVARAAANAAKQDAAERDRLINAYLSQLRRLALKTCPVGQQASVEASVRAYLRGREPA